MKESFNTNFYITVATVIPVLYLAIVLQGPIYANLIQRVTKAWLENLAIYFTLRIIAYVILVAWVAGEIAAIYALYAQSDTPSEQCLKPVDPPGRARARRRVYLPG